MPVALYVSLLAAVVGVVPTASPRLILVRCAVVLLLAAAAVTLYDRPAFRIGMIIAGVAYAAASLRRAQSAMNR